MKWKDPIVEEVREARRQIFVKCDSDIHKLCDYLRRQEKTVSAKPVRPARSAKRKIAM